MFRHITSYPGHVANDLLGEVGQQLLRGDKEWALIILSDLLP